MTAATAVLAGRAAAERLMVDMCTITRVAVLSTDPDTGQQARQTTTIYTGKCRVQMSMPGSASATEPGEAHLLLLSGSVQIPMAVVGVQPGDIVTITAAAHDPELVGRKFRIKDLGHKTHATARRLGTQEVT